MKRFIQKKVERIRLLAALLVTVCGFATANAQTESGDINVAILAEGSVPVRWTNDAEHPWYVPEGESYVRTPETEEDHQFISTLTFTYSSAYPTEISMEWKGNSYYNNDNLTFVVDGNEYFVDSYNSWTSNHMPFVVAAGDHTIQIIYDRTSNVYNDSYFAGIRNLRVWECKELESACLKEGSVRMTFHNDPEYMWITEDGYIRSTNYVTSQESQSRISTTITIDKASVFSFECRTLRNDGSNCRTFIDIDGVEYAGRYSSSWEYISVVLYPGEHIIEFGNIHTGKSIASNVTQIRNVCLDQTWYTAVLNSPGELRTRLIQALGDKNFQDAELVKIAGEMNDDDWSTIKQLTNIKAIDFRDTGITQIPHNACNGLSALNTVMLPETLVEIGNDAFYNTNFHRLTIPASVERIGDRVWLRTPLQFIDFAEHSKLNFIGYEAFYQTKIIEFKMPDSVVSLGRYNGWGDYECNTFVNCYDLKKLYLSANLLRIPYNIANNCVNLEELRISESATVIERNAFSNTGLKSVNLPESLQEIGANAFNNTALESLNIPKNVSTVGNNAFQSCKNLTQVNLNSLMWDMNQTFNGCPAIETIVLPCATPPSISSDPFRSVSKDNVRLIVPDFAINTYRGDPYWYQFSRNITSDNEASVSDYWGIRGNLTLDPDHVIQGTPSLDVFQGGAITFDTDTPQTFDFVRYETSESSPASFLSLSNTVTANGLETSLAVENANRWYFFAPVTDVRISDVKYSTTDAWVIRYYDGARRASENATSGNWVNVPSDGILKRGQGYIFQAAEAGVLTMPAEASQHDKFFGSNEVELELVDYACETAENAGWNFIANPYPCYYDIYYIDMEAPITVWNGSTYRAYSLSDGDRGDNTLVLRPMQPFFVQKATAGLTAGMTLDGRRTNSTIDRTRAPRPTTVDENRHKLNLEFFHADREKADDYTSIVINEDASMAYEMTRDASKFMSMDTEIAQLYSLGDNRHPMAINERPYEDGNVALGVYLPKTGETYRISARRADRQAWIFDAATGVEQDLTDGDYIFTASKTGIDNNRFSIRFAPATTAAEGIEIDDIKVSGNAGSITIKASSGAEIKVYSTDGSMITTTTAEGIIEIPVPVGVYVVKINGQSVKTIVK